MHHVPFAAAPPYEAPGHSGMQMHRLQGLEAGPADTAWIGTSLLFPGGGTTESASDVEKFYVCLEGEVTVDAREGEQLRRVVLQPLDSCRIAPGETRQLSNQTATTARVLLVMPKRPS